VKLKPGTKKAPYPVAGGDADLSSRFIFAFHRSLATYSSSSPKLFLLLANCMSYEDIADEWQG